MTIPVTLHLPEELVKQAHSAGLLTEERITRWLNEELQKSVARQSLREAVESIRAISDDQPPSLDDIQLRELRADDASFLIDALYHAIYVPPGMDAPSKKIVQNPDLVLYIEGFGTQRGDDGILAVHDVTPVGAAWSRLIRGYGFVDEMIPELSIALLPSYRGRGIGTRMLEMLLVRLKDNAEQVSLSVTLTNPALRLYERHGFRVIKVAGDSAVMLRDL